ncbi:MAG: hypothetical protein EAZ66_07410, partial [Alphaproteobacteria bacterium]
YSLASLINKDAGRDRSIAELSTLELIRAAPIGAYAGPTKSSVLKYRGHQRLSWPLSAGLTAMVGYSTLLLGGFSRQGIWWQILLASSLLLVMYTTHIVTLSEGPRLSGGWILAYTTPIVGIVFTTLLIWFSEKSVKSKRQSALNGFLPSRWGKS